MKHPNTEKFSLRRQFLNEYNGQLMFRSVHFPIHISDIVKECWFRCSKNIFQEFPNNINASEPDKSKPENKKNNTILEKSKADEKECTSDDTLQERFEKTNKLFEESGRTLNPQNIAVYLLDIGNLLSSSSLKIYGIRTQH